MVLQLLSLSGDSVQVDLEDASTIKDIRLLIATAMKCEPSCILLVASDGTDVLQDSQLLESLKSTSVTVINQSFDPMLIRLDESEVKRPCNGNDHSTTFSKTTKLLYDGNTIWERHDRQFCDDGGFRGRTHDVYLSECRKLLFCRGGTLRRSGVPEYDAPEPIRVHALLQKKGLR
mmetsp:Transcript_60035/g.133902  ORF Transcript_60035/g.133902 Transcript_60035/m.133902 type:complete len:175 (-) Transcript_60035:14-538(-)